VTRSKSQCSDKANASEPFDREGEPDYQCRIPSIVLQSHVLDREIAELWNYFPL
jgi:hypothetical protein